MDSIKINRNNKDKRGSAMIILIVVIAIGTLLFILKKAGAFKSGPGDPNAVGIMPWEEWDAREKIAEEAIQDGAKEEDLVAKIDIEPLEMKVSLNYQETAEQRGKIQLNISSLGVIGTWTGQYKSSTDKNVQIVGASGFAGQFYPDHTCDENGDEGSDKHYFLCKGKFWTQADGKHIVTNEMGELYVRGWIGKDKVIVGEFYKKGDGKKYHKYEFSGIARKPKPLFDL